MVQGRDRHERHLREERPIGIKHGQLLWEPRNELVAFSFALLKALQHGRADEELAARITDTTPAVRFCYSSKGEWRCTAGWFAA